MAGPSRKKTKKRRIAGGTDTHQAVVELMSRGRIANADFPTTSERYRPLPVQPRGLGRPATVGAEGTGSYGAGLTRYLRGEGMAVVGGQTTRPPPTPRPGQV